MNDMKHYIKYVIALYILTITAGLPPSFCEPSLSGPDRKPCYYIGGTALYNQRVGTHIFESLKKQQDITVPPLSLFGFNLGKRYYMKPWLRCQIDLILTFGNAVEDTSFHGIYFTRKNQFKIFSGIFDLHLVRPKTGVLDLFVLCGAGINYLRLKEHTVLPDDQSEEVSLYKYSAKNLKHWSPCLRLGAGLDITPKKNFGMSLEYSYWIWRPVKYPDEYDLPLYTIEYKERFFTHMVQVKFLFNLVSD